MTIIKREILIEMTQNIKLMNELDAFITVADFDPFVEARMKEWHDLRRRNAELVEEYKKQDVQQETQHINITLMQLKHGKGVL